MAKQKSIKSIVVAVVVGFVVLFGLIGFNSLVGNVDMGEYHIRQSLGTGTMTVHSKPGWYFKAGGDVEVYPKTVTFYFSKDDLDGGDGDEAKPMLATFMGNSTADVSGMMMVELPIDQVNRLAIHEKYRSIEAVRMTLVRNAIAKALKQTGPMFRPEEAFTTKRSEVDQLMRNILEEGSFLTETVTDTIKEQGKEIRLSRAIPLLKNGKKVRSEESSLKKYGIVINDFVIKDFDFDPETDKLIQAKKRSQQKIVAARSEAELSKQKALSAEEDGKARVAKAEADALVEKKTAVVAAEREAAVAEQNKIKAQLDADAHLATKRAEAEAARLKVKAGLTPQEKAEWDYKTSVGVAEHLSKVNMPELMVIGGGKGGSNNLNPFDAIGLESFHNLSKKMSKQ
jgi:regulator of protease activity HflC (stomatin/prohibitin superfamily)